jgi:hypothetical protein
MSDKEIFYPYRIEFNNYIFIDPLIFKDNIFAKDINNIGTNLEAYRIVKLYFPNATIEDKDIDSFAQRIYLNNKEIGYIQHKVFYY